VTVVRKGDKLFTRMTIVGGGDIEKSAWAKRAPYRLLYPIGLEGYVIHSISESDSVDLSHWCQSRNIYAGGS